MIQPLETRTLLAASLEISNHILYIKGTSGNDTIDVSLNVKKQIIASVGKVTHGAIDPAKLTRIDIDARAGDDIVSIEVGVTVPANINGKEGNDSITGGDGNDTIFGGDGINTLAGGAGNDVVSYASNTAPIDMDIGHKPPAKAHVDYVFTDVENVVGTQFDDEITDKGTSPVAIFGEGGNDSLKGNGDGDTLDGGDGRDTLVAGDGTGGNVRPATNVLLGGKDGDRLIAGTQKDSLEGGAGNDRFIPDSLGNGGDTINGGTGVDTLDCSGSTVGVNINIGGTAGGDTFGDDIEFVKGSDLNDTLSATTSRDLDLNGGKGNDSITGGAGDDTITGGPGLDTLAGGAGKDLFRAKDGEADSITVVNADHDVLNPIDPFGLDKVTLG